MIDHVTYEVPITQLRDQQFIDFFTTIGMEEIDPDPAIEKNWDVRWWEADNEVKVHLVGVGGLPRWLGLAHFCVVVRPDLYRLARASHWKEPIGSGVDRIWLKGPAGIRVEVRQAAE